MKNIITRTPFSFLVVLVALLVVTACEKEEIYEQTRLFRPVLNESLRAELNTIIINMGKIREASGYTIEISRDSFRTLDFKLEVDTHYVKVDNVLLKGDQLFWNTLYQVRATAHANDPQYDSKISDLGNVRTERFPTILNIPGSSDVIDVAARVTWKPIGAAVTKIKVFAPSDLKLTTPLAERTVSGAEQAAGVAIVANLKPETAYQLAIYSGADGSILRGWEQYKTLPAGIDLTDPNVINLTENEDPNAVINAVVAATEGQVIAVKKGVLYNLPTTAATKSVTIRGAYGFGKEKAVLYTTTNWDIAAGATIDHIRFVDVEVRGADIGGDYVFNPNPSANTTLRELTFDNCIINTFRGIIRIRGKMFVTNFNIVNSIVYQIGGYGVFTTDTDGAGNAAFDHLLMRNSTFSKINSFLTSRQNMKSVVIDACTINELAAPDGTVFRWRGTKGVLSNVLEGITIKNTIWGPAWDAAKTGNLNVRGIHEGLEATTFTIVNTYATSNFGFTAGTAIPGFPSLQYKGKPADLWVAPDGLDFNFKDSGFSGKFDSGDPRWRAKL